MGTVAGIEVYGEPDHHTQIWYFSTVPDYDAVCAATSYALQDALRKATCHEVR